MFFINKKSLSSVFYHLIRYPVCLGLWICRQLTKLWYSAVIGIIKRYFPTNKKLLTFICTAMAITCSLRVKAVCIIIELTCATNRQINECKYDIIFFIALLMACPIPCRCNNKWLESTIRSIFNQHKPFSISTITRICQ